MKNIFILPTNQPSRLHKIGNQFGLTENPSNNSLNREHHIYITSDEKIQEGEWVIDGYILRHPDLKNRFNGDTNPIKKLLKKGDLWKFYDGTSGYGSICKKIILTTDPTLIADGVQAIDNDFLEWFIKNPTCEFIKVTKLDYLTNRQYRIYNLPQEEPIRKIDSCYNFDIEIGCVQNICRCEQEEPKQESYICPHTKIQCDDECCVSAEDCHIISSLATSIEEPKQEKEEEYFKHLEKDKKEFAKEWEEIRQEFGFGKKDTLEEAAEQNYISKTNRIPVPTSHWTDSKELQIQNFIEGATYQAERMYSEEDMRKSFFQGWVTRERFDDQIPDIIYPKGLDYEEKQEYAFNLWFEQNKKK